MPLGEGTATRTSGLTDEQMVKILRDADGAPAWARHGPICTSKTYRSVVKLSFLQ